MSDHLAIIVANPRTPDDPLLLKDKQGYVFPRLIEYYRQAGVMSDCILSVPDSIPLPYSEILRSWDVDVAFSGQDLPQARLSEIAARTEWERFLAVTPYAYLLVAGRVREAAARLGRDGTHVVCDEGMTRSSHFVLCDRTCLEAVGKMEGFAVSPFVLGRYAGETLGGQAVASLPRGEDAASLSLLFGVMQMRERDMVAYEHVLDYLEKTPTSERFTHRSYCEYAAQFFGIADFQAFSGAVTRSLPPELIPVAAEQMRAAREMPVHYPESRDVFLELGFGSFPIISMLALADFKRAIAVEPYGEFTVPTELFQTLSDHAAQGGLAASVHGGEGGDRLQVFAKDVRDIGLEPESVDFIYSKTVFEHVMEVESTSRFMYEALRKGGRMLHQIDHSDHVDTQTIRFDFFKYDKPSWQQRQSVTNLWRVNDFVDLWTEMGFKVEVLDRKSRRVCPAEVHSCWERYDPEDLYCYASLILATK